MRPQKHLILAVAMAVFWALGAFQGQRLDEVRDATKFYRWMISSATQARVFGQDLFQVEGEDGPEYVDEVLFQRLVEVTEPRLDDPPSLGENDYDDNGNLLPKIVRYSNLHAFGNEGDGVEGTIDDAEVLARDRKLWALAQSNDEEVVALRADFIAALGAGQLFSVGDQVSLEEFYNQTADFGVSLGNMFFGFRKMAANLVWLEVDKFFHSGMAHRMIPAMQTTVALDPTFVDAYLLGAWHLAYNFTAKMAATPWTLREYDTANEAWVGPKERFYYEGVDFLKDGIRKNPRQYKLYFDLGYGIYYDKLDDNHNAVRYLREAIRPAHDVWVRRQLYRIMMLDGQYEDSIKGWEWYMKRYPDNVTAPRFHQQATGMMHERDAQRAAVKARAAEALAELEPSRASEWSAAAEEARAEEQRHWDAAIEIWTAMTESVGAGDTFATGRLYQRDAMQKAEQGRYLEAIALMDVARWEANSLWDELSNLMMEYKIEAGEPLQVTEIKAQRRLEEERRYTTLLPKSRDGILYKYRDGAWRSGAYANEPVETLAKGGIDWERRMFEHPEFGILLELGGDFIVRIDETWYRFEGEPLEDVIDPYANG